MSSGLFVDQLTMSWSSTKFNFIFIFLSTFQYKEAEREKNLILKGLYSAENCPPRLINVHSVVLVYYLFLFYIKLSMVLNFTFILPSSFW